MSNVKGNIKKLPTSWKMSITAFLAIVLIFIITYVSQFVLFRIWSINYEKDNIKTKLNEISIILNNNNLEDVSKEIIESNDTEVVIYKDKENILLKSGEDDLSHINLSTSTSEEINVDFGFDEDKITLTSPIDIKGESYYIYLQKDSDLFSDFLENTIPSAIVLLVVGLIFSLLAGIYVSNQFLNRLKKLTNTMKEVKSQGISSRVEIQNPNDEFDKVNIIFNDMMDSVENSFNSQKQFVQDASHELRTPLTILKGHLKMLDRWGKDDNETLEKSLKVSIDEVDRLTKLVNDLLELGKIESELGRSGDIVDIDLSTAINEVVYDFEIIKNDVCFEVECEYNLSIKMSKKHFKQLLIIFIDNAIKYCDKEEKKINIRTYKENEKVYISIKDNGIGIPSDEIPKISDKFYRVDKSRKYNNSFGIGLSIASQIINLYKCKLDIKSDVGVGSEFIVSCYVEKDNKPK